MLRILGGFENVHWTVKKKKKKIYLQSPALSPSQIMLLYTERGCVAWFTENALLYFPLAFSRLHISPRFVRFPLFVSGSSTG